jgi:hypothetical protein
MDPEHGLSCSANSARQGWLLAAGATGTLTSQTGQLIAVGRISSDFNASAFFRADALGGRCVPASSPATLPSGDTLGHALRWSSRKRQIASIVCLVAALLALFVLDVSWLFWVFVVASLALAAIDLWEKRRLGQ